jgi:UDP-2,3-diacylglucosamine pyrophosphatase LpxH
MNAIVVSDLHIGSQFFLHNGFESFLRNIPEECELILNGDVIDDPHQKLHPDHQRILKLIDQLSRHQRVVWVRGNHDNGYVPNGFEHIHFRTRYTIDNRLLISHGYDFDGIMPRSRMFMQSFEFIHDLMIKCGSRPIHVANFAKKFGLLYKVLRDNVMKNAVGCALENGYEAVVCGHTHFAEDRVFKGIRYMNTGAWTEMPAFYLRLTESEMALKKVDHTSSLR